MGVRADRAPFEQCLRLCQACQKEMTVTASGFLVVTKRPSLFPNYLNLRAIRAVLREGGCSAPSSLPQSHSGRPGPAEPFHSTSSFAPPTLHQLPTAAGWAMHGGHTYP